MTLTIELDDKTLSYRRLVIRFDSGSKVEVFAEYDGTFGISHNSKSISIKDRREPEERKEISDAVIIAEKFRGWLMGARV